MHPALASLLVLRSDTLNRPGNMPTFLEVSCRLCSSLQTSEAGSVLPLGMWKSFVGFLPVGM